MLHCMHVMRGWWPLPFGYRLQLKEDTLTTPYTLFYNGVCILPRVVRSQRITHCATHQSAADPVAQWFTLYKRNKRSPGFKIPPKSHSHSFINEHVSCVRRGYFLHVLNVQNLILLRSWFTPLTRSTRWSPARPPRRTAGAEVAWP